MSQVPLDSRVIRIVRWLIVQDGPRSTSQLAADLGLSERVIRYRLSLVERYLESHGAELVRQRGSGLVVIADDGVRDAIRNDLAVRSTEPRVYTPAERRYVLLDGLLWSWPETVSLDRLHEELEVSKTSARRDLRASEGWLDLMDIPVNRRPGKGLCLHGTEQRIRRALVQLFLESIPGDVLEELQTTDFEDADLIKVRVPAGLRDRFASLPMRVCSAALAASSLHQRLVSANSDLIFALFVAVTLARSTSGNELDLEPGQYRSLNDHPASDAVRELADSLATETGSYLSDMEMAGLTEYLLGLHALTEEAQADADMEKLANVAVGMAADKLHASLIDDSQLERSLVNHFGRLTIRLRYGLPVYNPLLAEVVERYPDVQAVSLEVAEHLTEHFGSEIHEDEVGFITMYLSGAMERANLRPRREALVVCPSGVATAWVLVSRLQAEFPELSLVEVLSATEYTEADKSRFDVVISTVALPVMGPPVVVVSPLLSVNDIKNLQCYT